MEKKILAFEIGTEELPAFALHAATIQLEKLFFDQKGQLFDFDSVKVYSTPRRLIAIVEGIPEATEALDEEFRGPAARIAFDDAGNPTKAAIGFARGKGLTEKDLFKKEFNGEEYVFAIKHTDSQKIMDVLPGFLTSVITDISWPKTQRWGSRREAFSRPVRWILALFGNDIVPVSFAGLESSNLTYGHRFLAPGPQEVSCACKLIDVLRDSFVVPSENEREESIRAQVKDIEANTGLVAELPAHTMAEVVNLCEYPTVLVGSFDESFLAVPKEITVDAMLVHQRYFPLFNQDGTLANKFLVTGNGDPKFSEHIIDGNQRVVAARLYDAKFFYDEDLKKPLESYVEKLKDVVFQEALGTTFSKTHRVEKLAEFISQQAQLSEIDSADAKRAAYLCKADLVTGAVVEFTSVQGIMGRYYAIASGETKQVADAIADHYRPKFSGDALPETAVGKVVAVADKIDTICGLFAVGQAPTGSSDPFALRRQSLGIISMLDAGLNVSLVKMIDYSLDLYLADGIQFDKKSAAAQIIEFFITRTKVNLKDAGSAIDTIDAVLAVREEEPAVIMSRVRALDSARANDAETFDDLATAYARANNLRDKAAGVAVDESMLNDVESSLLLSIKSAEAAIAIALENDDYPAALVSLASLRQPIDAFFDGVMVMDKDEAVRSNRMKLLNRFVSVFTSVADFGKMVKQN